MKTKYDWSSAKDWTNYISRDSDGVIYQFSIKPTKDHQCWYLEDVEYSPVNCLPFSSVFSYFEGDWQDSLEERP